MRKSSELPGSLFLDIVVLSIGFAGSAAVCSHQVVRFSPEELSIRFLWEESSLGASVRVLWGESLGASMRFLWEESPDQFSHVETPE